jgi:HAD superfamily hydrolase (TIGR01484 family)
MRYHVLACDYDGTLATDGRVGPATVKALERLLATGRKLVLVTGRELDQLLDIFPEIHFFASVVAENGALLYDPASKAEKVLCKAPPEAFVSTLRARGVAPISVGRVIVATWRPHEAAVLDTIRELGLEMQVIFNKDAVMVLPSGVNKATGLSAALAQLGYSAHETVGVGDAENDHALLGLCECGAAVANALPGLKAAVDLTLTGDHGEGVAELIDQIVENDLGMMEGRLARHRLLLGQAAGDQEIYLPPYGRTILIAGPSGSGKSTAASSVLEQLAAHRYQFCIIDPEGDFENLDSAITLGTRQHGPAVDEVMKTLASSRETSVVINLVGLPVADRPTFFLSLLPHLQEMRARTGHPHWLIMDEAHHLLPAAWEPGLHALTDDWRRVVLITVHPGQLARAALAGVEAVMLVGQQPQATLDQFYAGLGESSSTLDESDLADGEVFLWSKEKRSGHKVRLTPSRLQRRRHGRKYAEGELPPDRSFYFQGPEGKLNLRAQNLMLFMQLADGVDDATWTYHLQQGDYSRWFAERIKDETLANQARDVERQAELSPLESRAQIRFLIEQLYTAPTGPPLPMPGTDAASAQK